MDRQCDSSTSRTAPAVSPNGLRSHLRHVVREWDEWVPQMEDYSHCIEIRYEAPFLATAEGR